MRKNIFIILICFAYLSAYAQKETSNWTFGYGCGLTWNTTRSVTLLGQFGTPNATLSGLPTTFTSAISTLEGCFTMSDKNGNLLFYSDGTNVWNKNHVRMSPGINLTGNTSSPQSGIIIPYFSATRYMAITMPAAGIAGNLAYTIVDMSLNGGLGELDQNNINVRFRNPSGSLLESVTTTKHANGIDYWTVAPGAGSTSYINAWLVSSSNVATTPVVTVLPTSVAAAASSGYFKITPDGKHFVYVTGANTPAVAMYGDFNSSTGKFSNIKTITGLIYPYGIEFSQFLKYVYIAGTNKLYVFNFEALLTTNNPATVIPKTFILDPPPTPSPSSIQMGPDGRLYICQNQGYEMYIVDNPEEYNNLKIYKTPAGFPGNKLGVGLPSFSGDLFAPRGVMPVNPTLRTKSY